MIDQQLYIVLISVHGLVRGENIELGRDADTGGQVAYVVELAKALSQNPQVYRVDLLTRQIFDRNVDDSYADPAEKLTENAFIIRLPCGPRRYLRKERLWPYLDEFVDNALLYFRKLGHMPDIIHGHYADAGLVGANLSNLLGLPLIFTGHSLGRVKKQRLIDKGQDSEQIEQKYNISQRIEAEEIALENAGMVVTSTRQEMQDQYGMYGRYNEKKMMVIPPGINLSSFSPPKRTDGKPPIFQEIARFLKNPKKPMILTISRPDERKNICALVRAYAEHPHLRDLANLVIFAGSRQEIKKMDAGARRVLRELLMLIDKYDLYGSVAYPKTHQSTDVPDIYRLAMKSRGVFINPALTEPFGLTIVEAAASGVPVIATNDGGPTEILEKCNNGLLIDPLDEDAMGESIHQALTNPRQWMKWSKSGVRESRRHYTWSGHVDRYVKLLNKRFHGKRRSSLFTVSKSRLPKVDRLIITDLDGTLLGDREAAARFVETLKQTGDRVGFGVATGRRLESAAAVLKQWNVPMPDIWITAVGTEIHYGEKQTEDKRWTRHLEYQWKPDAVREALAELPGLTDQPASEQLRYKISYFIDEDAPSKRKIIRHLRKKNILVNVIHSCNEYLDILPIRASKGQAIRYLAGRWGLQLDHILIAGDSGNDEEMLKGATLGVVVGNHSPELKPLKGKPRTYFADGENAWGILEAIEYYDFLGAINPRDESDDQPH